MHFALPAACPDRPTGRVERDSPLVTCVQQPDEHLDEMSQRWEHYTFGLEAGVGFVMPAQTDVSAFAALLEDCS